VSVSRAPRRPLWITRLRGLSRVLLFSGHDEILAPRQWKNKLSELVSNGEFQRDGMMLDGPSASCPGASQSIFSVSSTHCGTQVTAKDNYRMAKGSARPRLIRAVVKLSCTLCMRIHPPVAPPPDSSLGMYAPCPHRASALCVGGCSTSSSCRLRWCLTGEVAGEYWRVLRRIQGLSTK
jgi:hypothetical protein